MLTNSLLFLIQITLRLGRRGRSFKLSFVTGTAVRAFLTAGLNLPGAGGRLPTKASDIFDTCFVYTAGLARLNRELTPIEGGVAGIPWSRRRFLMWRCTSCLHARWLLAGYSAKPHCSRCQFNRTDNVPGLGCGLACRIIPAPPNGQ
jgi:hypothetical protein